MTKHIHLIAAGNGFIVVALGAFGAHGLEPVLGADRLATWQTGIDYHVFHTLALLATGILLQQFPASPLLRISGLAFLAGILLFCGSLYLLALTDIGWLGAITPIGGVAFLCGWVCQARFAWQQRSN